MKVVISIDPIRYPLTGIGRYTLELVSRLSKLPALQLRYLAGARMLRELPDFARASPDRPGRGATLKQRLASLGAVLEIHRWTQNQLACQALKPYRDHIYHGPNFYLPRFAGKSVVTIHDLSVFTHEECHRPERVRMMRKQIRMAIERADRVITPSEFARQDVASQLNFPADRVHAIPLAASAEFRPRTAAETASVMRRYGLTHGQFCLFSGTVEPRKNLPTLLSAYRRLGNEVRRRIPLVISGYGGWRSEATHAKLVEFEREGWLRYLGFTPQADLVALYSAARVFVFPSLHEGFGLPVLEAMASGVPVICSNSASLPEVAGDAAVLCQAEDADAFEQAILSAIEDPQWRQSRIAAGLEHSGGYSWERTASLTSTVYAMMS